MQHRHFLAIEYHKIKCHKHFMSGLLTGVLVQISPCKRACFKSIIIIIIIISMFLICNFYLILTLILNNLLKKTNVLIVFSFTYHNDNFNFQPSQNVKFQTFLNSLIFVLHICNWYQSIRNVT